MGAQFSADAEDTQILVRDRIGRLILHTGKMEEATTCTSMPVDLETGAPTEINNKKIPMKDQRVQMLFFPSSNYQGQNLHLHTFEDKECDIPANDVVSPEYNFLNKNLNHIKQSRISNSNYFEYNKFPVNRPFYPKFIQRVDYSNDSVNMPASARRSSYRQCTIMPYFADAQDKKPVQVRHNTVPMKIYMDKECKQEYINTLTPPPTFSGKQNVDNRSVPIQDQDNEVRHTRVTSYILPAKTTNAAYYRLYEDDYPT